MYTYLITIIIEEKMDRITSILNIPLLDTHKYQFQASDDNFVTKIRSIIFKHSLKLLHPAIAISNIISATAIALIINCEILPAV